MGKNRIARKMGKLEDLKAFLLSAINAAITKNGLSICLITPKQLIIIKWVSLVLNDGVYGVVCILRDHDTFYRRLLFVTKDGRIQENEYYQLRKCFYTDLGKAIYTV